jgi:hypothetical protein
LAIALSPGPVPSFEAPLISMFAAAPPPAVRIGSDDNSPGPRERADRTRPECQGAEQSRFGSRGRDRLFCLPIDSNQT